MHRRLYKLLTGSIAALATVGLPSGVAAASQPKNYWLVSSTGQVFAYGKAKTHGSEVGKHYSGRITGIKGTVNGGGYWIVTTKKHYSFGDASHYKYRANGLKRVHGQGPPEEIARQDRGIRHSDDARYDQERGRGYQDHHDPHHHDAHGELQLSHDSDRQPARTHSKQSLQPGAQRRGHQRRELVLDTEVRQPSDRSEPVQHRGALRNPGRKHRRHTEHVHGPGHQQRVLS